MYGSKIKTIREARGFTQDYMFLKTGIPQNTYSKIETDSKVKVNDDTLLKIAEVLGVSLSYIKSPTPIVMNFDNFKNNSNLQFGSDSIQNNHINEKLIEQLTSQLLIKDKQIIEKDKQILELLKKIN